MSFRSNGDQLWVPREKPASVYALVIYLPDPLGRFLDDLRRELVPGCNPHAHVSVLPPRTLKVDWQLAGEQVRECATEWAPFDVELGGLRMFPVTNVIYLELARGADELRRMHAMANSRALESAEPFQYHPHITVAQELDPDEVDTVNQLAHKRWQAFTGPRGFRADHTTFVRNTAGDCWTDLEQFPLVAVPSR
ncbi:MAG TPA: 2'-5' RNA ligase family protein [Candidatus Acidoferrales bacterium]|nr:2'-5' RNA ligase family protein [Candidatus Acidoferrales bacterium]